MAIGALIGAGAGLAGGALLGGLFGGGGSSVGGGTSVDFPEPTAQEIALLEQQIALLNQQQQQFQQQIQLSSQLQPALLQAAGLDVQTVSPFFQPFSGGGQTNLVPAFTIGAGGLQGFTQAFADQYYGGDVNAAVRDARILQDRAREVGQELGVGRADPQVIARLEQEAVPGPQQITSVAPQAPSPQEVRAGELELAALEAALAQIQGQTAAQEQAGPLQQEFLGAALEQLQAQTAAQQGLVPLQEQFIQETLAQLEAQTAAQQGLVPLQERFIEETLAQLEAQTAAQQGALPLQQQFFQTALGQIEEQAPLQAEAQRLQLELLNTALGELTAPEAPPTEAEQLAQEIELEFLRRSQAALAGELPVDPALERALEEGRGTLEESLRRQLGPGFATSTPGIEALANFDQRAEELRSGARRAELTVSEQLGQARAAQEQARLQGLIGGAGVIGGGLSRDLGQFTGGGLALGSQLDQLVGGSLGFGQAGRSTLGQLLGGGLSLGQAGQGALGQFTSGALSLGQTGQGALGQFLNTGLGLGAASRAGTSQLLSGASGILGQGFGAASSLGQAASGFLPTLSLLQQERQGPFQAALFNAQQPTLIDKLLNTGLGVAGTGAGIGLGQLVFG